MKTVKNKHGEEIHVKVEKETIFVHHTDCTDGFITFDELCLKYVIETDEVLLILNTAKKIYMPTIMEKIKEKFKNK